MSDFNLSSMSPEAVKEVSTRTIYTIDGLWFLAVEEAFGFDAAFELNQRVWVKCGQSHARRLVRELDLDGKAPFDALETLLFADPIMSMRRPQVVSKTDTRMVFRTLECQTQYARIRDGRGAFDGKPGCTLLMQAYAEAIDPRMKATCISCAPNGEESEYWCEWEFTLPETKSSTD